jgi:hypothetical protein
MHGTFLIRPQKHLDGQGCPQCGAVLRGHRKDVKGASKLSAATKVAKFAAVFAKTAGKVHSNAYDYSKVRYAKAQAKVEIVCNKHGSFWQTPEHHIKRAYGCPQCAHNVSKVEVEIARFLEIFTPVIRRDRSLIKPKELDIFLPEHKIAVEYCGMYWHSAFSAKDDVLFRSKHISKYQAARDAGIKLITLYETDWRDHKPQVKRLLRNLVGKSRGKLMARKCCIKHVLHGEARSFFEAYHPQGGDGVGEHYGLFWKDKIVACMRFTLGGNDRGRGAKDRVWTLSRFATRLSVVGAASRLFSAFVKEHNPALVKSFSDNRLFTGGMYRKLGFNLEEESGADYSVWSEKRLELKPKSHFQRRYLEKRQKEHGFIADFNPGKDVRTERDVTFELGCGRIYDCGKKRWMWLAKDLNFPG